MNVLERKSLKSCSFKVSLTFLITKDTLGLYFMYINMTIEFIRFISLFTLSCKQSYHQKQLLTN